MALPWNLIPDVRWNDFLSTLGAFIEDTQNRLAALEGGGSSAVATLYDGGAFAGSLTTWQALAGSPSDDDYDFFIVTGVEASEIGTTIIVGDELRTAAAVVAGETVTDSDGLPLNTTIASYGRIGLTTTGEILVGDRQGVQSTVSRLHIVGIKLG